MEHLFPPPYDTELQASPPRTPWLGYTQHDDYPLSCFGDYPATRGWDKSQIDSEDENATWKWDGATTLQMLQSWLYFGYLEAVTKEVIPVTALVRREQDGSVWLCTRTLPEILQRFQDRLYEIGAGESRQRWAREIKEASSEAVQWANDLSFAPRMQRQLPGGFRTLMPAIVILYETVEHAIRGCFCALHRSSRYHAGTDEVSAPPGSVGGSAGEDEGGWLVSTPCESAECSDKFFTARVCVRPDARVSAQRAACP